MQLYNIHSTFDVSEALERSNLLPARIEANEFPISCGNCSYINHKEHNFCTNCGYPIYPNPDRLAIYNHRMQKRKSLQQLCFLKIEHARNALYVLAAFSMLGIFYVFSDIKQKAMTGFVMVVLGFIYAGLGRWSLRKPFTALLISLIIMLSFAVINTWAELSSMFTTASGIYLLIIQVVLIYFLLQGVKGAFHADILEEEFKL